MRQTSELCWQCNSITFKELESVTASHVEQSCALKKKVVFFYGCYLLIIVIVIIIDNNSNSNNNYYLFIISPMWEH